MFAADPALPILVVGGVNELNGINPVSRTGPLVNAWAGGEDVYCPSEGDDKVEVSGTSYAAGLVAGLAAYLLSIEKYAIQLSEGGIPHLAENMLHLIATLSWKRNPGNVATVSNGIELLSDCLIGDVGVAKRQQCCKSYDCSAHIDTILELIGYIASGPKNIKPTSMVAHAPQPQVPSINRATIPSAVGTAVSGIPSAAKISSSTAAEASDQVKTIHLLLSCFS